MAKKKNSSETQTMTAGDVGAVEQVVLGTEPTSAAQAGGAVAAEAGTDKLQ